MGIPRGFQWYVLALTEAQSPRPDCVLSSPSARHAQVFFSHCGSREPLALDSSTSLPLPPPVRFEFLYDIGAFVDLTFGVQIEMHACFAHCTITINEGVRNLLNEGAPYHMFQVWLHSAVMDLEEYYDYM